MEVVINKYKVIAHLYGRPTVFTVRAEHNIMCEAKRERWLPGGAESALFLS